MGNHTSLGTKTVLVTLQLILLINYWTVYEPQIWDQTEVKVWVSATKNDKVAVGFISTWRAASEALKSQVEPQSQTCGLPDSEGATGTFTNPTATPWAPLLVQPSKAFAVALPADLNVPFDPGLLAFARRWICFSLIREERDT